MTFQELQEMKVSQIINKLKDENTKQVVFKSPTGSGKTIMLADIMNTMIRENPNYVFLVSSLSKGELAEQNFNSFNNRVRKGYCPLLKPYLINPDAINTEGGNRFPTKKNVYVLPRDLLKSNTRIAKDNSLKRLLDNLKIEDNKTIILIKDECHNMTKNIDDYSEYFEKKLLVSATPRIDRRQIPDVEMTEQEAIAAHLIKEVEYHTEEVPLEEVLRKFQSIKKQYLEKMDINPCMLIQISNEKDGEEEKRKILNVLQNTEFSNLHWIYIVGDEEENETNDTIIKSKRKNDWRKRTKEANSTIDIVIFKLSLAEGWDIPRACMLYQVRDTQSKILDEQVIGRVRRNPKLLEYEDLSVEEKEIISKAYVYGKCEVKNIEKTKVKLANPEEVEKEIKIKTTVINPRIKSLEIRDLIRDTSPLVPPSIFKLNKQIEGITDKEVKAKINAFIKEYADWFAIGYNQANIKTKIRQLNEEGLNPEIKKDINGNDIEISLPENSSFLVTNYSEHINDWVWTKVDEGNEFSFDSEAEKEWFEKIYNLIKSKNSHNKSIGKKFKVAEEEYNFLIAKNYFDNSKICFEYYNDGIKKSYPDFILKDRLNRLHFFESKSLNASANQNISNRNEYEDKIQALRKGYKEASSVVPYHFYIPIKEGDDWNIFHSFNGQEESINCDKLKGILKGEN